MNQEKRYLKEVERIRKKYANENIDSETYQRIKELDNNTACIAKKASTIIGCLGAVLLIAGLCFIFVCNWIFAGVLVSIAGLVCISLTWPVYARVIRKEREKIKYEILFLCEAYSSDV